MNSHDKKSDLFPHFWLITLLAAMGVRVYYLLIQGGMHFPDEIFQYVEPAHWRITGSGWLSWEYQRGLRNWILPSVMGSWIEIFRYFGLRSIALQQALWVMMIGVSLFVMYAAAGIGQIVTRSRKGGQLAALVTGLFPIIGWLSPHTLSGNFGLLFTIWSTYFWFLSKGGGELNPVFWKRKDLWFALLAGTFLGMGVGFRFTIAVLIPVVALDYNFRSRFQLMFAFLGGLGLAFICIGLVDWLTWGNFLHSFIEFGQFHLVDRFGAEHDVMSWHFYLDKISLRLGLSLPLYIVLVLVGIHRHWLLTLQAAVFIFVHSMIGHKEERYILAMWPFITISVSSGIWVIAQWFRREFPDRKKSALAVVILTLSLLVPVFFGVRKARMDWYEHLFEAQQWVGRQTDATGLMYESQIHLNGGYFILDAPIPQTPLKPALLDHQLFNYVALTSDRWTQALKSNSYELVHSFDHVTVYRRITKKAANP